MLLASHIKSYCTEFELCLSDCGTQVSDILSEADTVLRCMKKSMVLKPTNTTIIIEGASFAFTMFAFCERQKRIFKKTAHLSSDSCEEMAVITELEQLSPMYLKGATTNYEKVHPTFMFMLARVKIVRNR